MSVQWGWGYAATRMSHVPGRGFGSCHRGLPSTVYLFSSPEGSPLALWPSDAISPSFEHHHHAAQGVTPTARPPNGLCLTSPAMYASGSRHEAQPPAPLCGRVANCKLKQLTPCIAVSNEQSPILSTPSSLRAQIACCKLDRHSVYKLRLVTPLDSLETSPCLWPSRP